MASMLLPSLVDSTDSINLLKDTIIDFKSNGYCYRYNNLIITIYYETNENYIGADSRQL